MPIFILGLVRLGVLTADRLRKNRRIGYVGMLAFAILLPTVDPVSLVLETVPLLVLFEASIWISVFMERRWERAAPKPKPCEGRLRRLRPAWGNSRFPHGPPPSASRAEAPGVRVVSADWVVPVEGEPIRRRRGRDRRRRADHGGRQRG